MKTKIRLFLITLIGCAPSVSLGQPSDPSAALKIISDFAQQQCIPRGNRTDTQIKADISGGLNGLMSKMADVHVSASPSFSRDEYEGVLQQQLTGNTLDPVKCKEGVLDKLYSVFFK